MHDDSWCCHPVTELSCKDKVKYVLIRFPKNDVKRIEEPPDWQWGDPKRMHSLSLWATTIHRSLYVKGKIEQIKENTKTMGCQPMLQNESRLQN